MNLAMRWFRLGCALGRGVMAGSIIYFAGIAAAQGIWSSAGRVPSAEMDASRDIISPSGKRFVRGTTGGLKFGEVGGLTLFPLPITAMPPLWEVVWAPDSKRFAINFSDGGAVGTWDAEIFESDTLGYMVPLHVSELIRKASNSLSICDSPEVVNVGLLGWGSQRDVVLLVAEVPPHSSCKNMGALQGFMVSLASNEILEVVSESVMRERWARMLGERLLRR